MLKLVTYPLEELKQLRKDNQQFFETIFALLKQAYAKIGGLHSYKSANHLAKGANEIKCAYNNTELVACAIYYIRSGFGPKCSAIGGIQTPFGKEGVKHIIKDDIGKWKEFYWLEASGPIEHWYEKLGGFPIPTVYVNTILNQTLELDDDGYHYSRQIQNYMGETVKIRKKMFGFPNKQIYDLIEKEMNKDLLAWLDNQRKNVDTTININEAKLPFDGRKLSKYDFAIIVIENIMDRARYGGYDFQLTLTKQLYQYFIDAYHILKNGLKNSKITKERKREFETILADVEEGLESLSVLELHKL